MMKVDSATWTASTMWLMVNAHRVGSTASTQKQSSKYWKYHFIPPSWCHLQQNKLCNIQHTLLYLMTLIVLNQHSFIMCLIVFSFERKLQPNECLLLSGPLPRRCGEGRSSADGTAQHQLALPARQPCPVRPEAAGHAARQAGCLLLRQLRVRLHVFMKQQKVI